MKGKNRNLYSLKFTSKLSFTSSQLQPPQSAETQLFENFSCYSVPSIWNSFLISLWIVSYLCMCEFHFGHVCLKCLHDIQVKMSANNFECENETPGDFRVKKAVCSYIQVLMETANEPDCKEINSKKGSQRLTLSFRRGFSGMVRITRSPGQEGYWKSCLQNQSTWPLAMWKFCLHTGKIKMNLINSPGRAKHLSCFILRR